MNDKTMKEELNLENEEETQEVDVDTADIENEEGSNDDTEEETQEVDIVPVEEAPGWFKGYEEKQAAAMSEMDARLERINRASEPVQQVQEQQVDPEFAKYQQFRNLERQAEQQTQATNELQTEINRVKAKYTDFDSVFNAKGSQIPVSVLEMGIGKKDGIEGLYMLLKNNEKLAEVVRQPSPRMQAQAFDDFVPKALSGGKKVTEAPSPVESTGSSISGMGSKKKLTILERRKEAMERRR